MGIKEVRGQLEERRAKLKTVFDEAGSGDELDVSKVKSLGESLSSAEVVEKIREINTEIDDLAKQVEDHDELKSIHQANEQRSELEEIVHPTPGRKGDRQPQGKSFGDEVLEALEARGDEDGALSLKRRGLDLPEADLKTLFATDAGWAPESIRTGRLVDKAVRPIQVLDLIPSGQTSSAAIKYMEETTFTNNAAETAEGAEKPEAALALTERTESVRKIPVWIPVTDEQLEDVPQIRGYLNNRLPFMVRQRLDGQVLVGDGDAPNLSGILDRSGLQTQAKGADPVPDGIYKAMTKVRVTGRALPSGVALHPNDWQEIRLLRTTEGVYIWGSPSEAGPERIWGLPVAQTDALTEGTGLVGDFANFTELAIRSGITVSVSDSHSDYFIKNKQAIRAEMRAALLVYRPAAFCQVTGI